MTSVLVGTLIASTVLVSSGLASASVSKGPLTSGAVRSALSTNAASLAPPSTAVLAPASGATLKGTSALLDASASAASGLTITKVQFALTGGTYSKSVIGTATPSLYGYLYSWNTTTVPSGTYTLQSLASDSAGTSTYSAGVTVTVGNTPFKPCTTLSANTVVTPGTYVINCTEDVPTGITLNVDPGVTFKFGSGDEFTVEGILNAVATTANPIIFTSVNDNSVGGIAGTGSPAAGDWPGISVTGSVTMKGALVKSP
jgi:hypothetical protein